MLKNKKGKKIIVECTDDITTIVIVSNIILIVSCLSLKICCLTDGVLIMDSDCLFHSALNRNCFTIYWCTDRGKMQLRNNIDCNVMGVGDVGINMHGGVMGTFIEVSHDSKLKKNLI